MLRTLAGLAALAGLILLILALAGVASGLLTLGIILLVVGGVVFIALSYYGTRGTTRRNTLL